MLITVSESVCVCRHVPFPDSWPGTGGLTLTWCSVLFGGSGTVRGISVISAESNVHDMWRIERSAKTNTRSHRIGTMAYTLIQGDSEVTNSWKKWKGKKMRGEMKEWLIQEIRTSDWCSTSQFRQEHVWVVFWLGNPVIIVAKPTILYDFLSSITLFFVWEAWSILAVDLKRHYSSNLANFHNSD